MQKPAAEMSLRDLMDKLDEMRFERMRQEEQRRKAQRSSNQLLSMDDLAEYFGAGAGEIRINFGFRNTVPVYFRKTDLQA